MRSNGPPPGIGRAVNSCYLWQMSVSEKKKIFNFSLLKRVIRYAKPYRKKFIISILLAFVISALTPIRPILIQQTVDKYIRNDMPRMIVLITIIQVAILLLETLIRYYFTWLTAWLGQHVVKDLRVEVYKKILSLNLSQYNKTPVGTLTTRTINDIESVNDIFADGIVPILADLLSIVVVVSVMSWYDWRLTLAALLPFPIILFATYYFKESVNRSFHSVRNAVAKLNAFVQEQVTGIAVVQAFTAEEKQSATFKKINADHRDANIRAIFAYSVFFPVVEIILALSIALMVWKGAAIPVDAGVIVAFILLLNLIFRPLRVIADKFNVIQMGMVAGERVFGVLDNDDVTHNKTGVKETGQPFKGKISFQQVWFGYNPEHPVLSDVTFTVEPGDTIAIVGQTGSGKTTIISLLNRLYEVTRGEIQIDDRPIHEYPVEELRNNIGVVLQDVYLFSGSVLENITLNNSNVSREQVMEAAKIIGIHDFIMQLPGGYDFNVMERGATLSMGQRQLLSFLRALLYNPSILVLDEATSSVDAESERLIEKAIDTLITGRTSVIIAHRLSTIRKAKKIIVMDKGRLLEAGSHAELLAANGRYAKLYRMQFEVYNEP
jgi:ATP-binding cassette, subfamily B, multidrug efflux pump